ncbi:DUF1840 domain-containing protein [uncultured Piscinibacter sp.]|uniref:DUF1840 domain-containing protein n=1 Tax=uncultured Piscinibacter sp. TaxID=1131835 RepID=UPI0026253949|nr:DUF1840 domain-containing protein [uncultured Piscinibacter sp.]
MSYRFHSKAAGDVLMLEPEGDAVLTAMGIVPAKRGIIEPAAMAAALRAIEGAIERSEASPTAAGAEADDEGERYVSLRQRAWPLMEMMKRSLAANVPIVWGV